MMNNNSKIFFPVIRYDFNERVQPVQYIECTSLKTGRTPLYPLLSRHCKISKVSSFELVSELINFEILQFRIRIGFLINYFRISNFELDSELINFEIFRLRIVPILPRLIHCIRKSNPMWASTPWAACRTDRLSTTEYRPSKQQPTPARRAFKATPLHLPPSRRIAPALKRAV